MRGCKGGGGGVVKQGSRGFSHGFILFSRGDRSSPEMCSCLVCDRGDVVFSLKIELLLDFLNFN